MFGWRVRKDCFDFVHSNGGQLVRHPSEKALEGSRKWKN